MSGNYDPVDVRTPSRRRSLIAYLLLPGLFFLLGLAAMGWLLSRWDAAARVLGVAPDLPATAAAQPATPVRRPAQPVTPSTAPESAEPERIAIDPEIARRVAALENRIVEVDTQSRAAIGNADRAEGLLVAFATRRALDRGVPLGFLEALLRQRFGATQPQAVGTIIAAARQPITLQELQDGLATISPDLTGAGPEQNWWQALQAEIGSLVIVRREGTPSTVPAERLRRATRRLEAGQVDVALAEVLRLPGRENARNWVEDARRYVRARRALDAIETAALLEPRTARAAATAVEPRVR